jgi:hypothetical protein
MSKTVKQTLKLSLILLLPYGLFTIGMISLHLSYGDANGHLSYPFWSPSIIPLIYVTAPLRWLGIPDFDGISPFSLLVAGGMFLLLIWGCAWTLVNLSQLLIILFKTR